MTALHDQITGKIREQLEQNRAPWRRPWTGGMETPFRIPDNKTTGKAYRGINVPLLWMAADEKHYTSHRWASFKQWAGQKQFVAQGEKATPIVFYDTIEKQKDDKVEKIPFLKMSFVFNECQLKSYVPQEPVEQTDFVTRIQNADNFINNTGAVVKHGGSQAFYSPAQDYIQMPPTFAFIGTETQSPTESYYSTKLHELSHWTAPEKRCNRQVGKKFGDKAYAGEELVAEMSSAFLCAELEITDGPQPDNVSYLAHWIDMLKENSNCIFTAARMATKAGDYLHSLQP